MIKGMIELRATNPDDFATLIEVFEAATALGIVSALVPLFGYGWQAMTQDPETHFRQELGKRINKRKTDEANLTLILQLAAMLDCHCLHITLPYALGEEQLATLARRLPRWQLTLRDLLLVAELPLPAGPAR